MSSRVSTLVALLLAACTADPEPSDPPAASGEPVAPAVGDLLIEELYTCGAPPAGGTDHYYSDQFIELVNAAQVPLDLSGVLLGEVFGSAGEINPGMAPDSFREKRPDEVVMSTVWQIPEGVTLAPGATLVIAHDGVNHRPFSSVDLSSAGLEAFVEGSDDDAPTVDNLVEVVFDGGNDWLLTVFGPSVVLVEAGTELGSVNKRLTAPVDAVLDGVDTLMNADSAAFKRLPDAVDAGFTYVTDIYVGESVHRKRDGDGWQDTNHSGDDFEIGAPTPTFDIPDGTVSGDPWIDLGTGATVFEPLTDGGPIELVAGPQGGFHVDVAVHYGGFGPSGILLVYDAVDTDGEVISFETRGQTSEFSVTELDGGWQRVGDRVVMDITSPDDLVGSEITLRLTATLGDVVLTADRTVIVVDDE